MLICKLMSIVIVLQLRRSFVGVRNLELKLTLIWWQSFNLSITIISTLISRRYIMQWMTLPISFRYFACKGYLLANYKDKCLALSPGTSGCSSNTPYIFAWITGVVEKYYMVYSTEVDSPRCSVTSCHNELFVTHKHIIKQETTKRQFWPAITSEINRWIPVSADHKLGQFFWWRAGKFFHTSKPRFLCHGSMER